MTHRLYLLLLLSLPLLAACGDDIQGPDDDDDPIDSTVTPITRPTEWRGMHGNDDGNFAYDIDGAADGSIYVAGFASDDDAATDAYLLKLDAGGNRLWEMRFGDEEDQVAYTVAATPDGGAMLAGTHTIGHSPFLYMIKVDAAGEMEWDSIYRAVDGDRIPYEMAVAPGGGYVLTGRRQLSGEWTKAMAMKIDDDGAILWESGVGSLGQAIGYDVAVAADGSVAISYEMMDDAMPSFAGWIAVTTLDPNGNVVHERKDSINLFDYKPVALAAVGNDFILAGITVAEGVTDAMRVTRIDRAGNEIWRTIEPFAYSRVVGLLPDDEGIFTAVSSASPFIEIDAAGAVTGRYRAALWVDAAEDAARTADGGFAVIRNTQSPHIGTESEIEVLKVRKR